MDDKLNMQDIIDLLVLKSDVTKEEAEKFIVELFSLIEKGLTADELTKIKDFGSFKLTHIQERESVDVNTKEIIVIPAHKRVNFIPAQFLKVLVNKPFAHFETTPLNDGVFADGIPEDTQSGVESPDEVDNEPTETTDGIIPINKDKLSEDDTVNESSDKDDKTLHKLEEQSVDVSDSESSNAHESNIIEPLVLPKESVESDSKHSVEKDKSATSKLEVSSNSRKKSKKLHLRYVLMSAVVLLFFVVMISFAYNYYFTETPKIIPSDVEAPVAQKGVTSVNTESVVDESEKSTVAVNSVDTLERQTAKMSPGRTLRLIALDKYGNKEFWIYIYILNKNKIENPNVIPVGLVLELPHQSEYPMNPNNPDDVALAKKLGDDLIKGL